VGASADAVREIVDAVSDGLRSGTVIRPVVMGDLLDKLDKMDPVSQLEVAKQVIQLLPVDDSLKWDVSHNAENLQEALSGGIKPNIGLATTAAMALAEKRGYIRRMREKGSDLHPNVREALALVNAAIMRAVDRTRDEIVRIVRNCACM